MGIHIFQNPNIPSQGIISGTSNFFIEGSDVFVLPSRSEGIPRCVMESMAAKVPVVVSDIPGCRYLVDGKTTGLVFQVDRFDQLAEALSVLLSNVSLRNKFSQNGLKFVESEYSATRMAEEYTKLYFDLISN